MKQDHQLLGGGQDLTCQRVEYAGRVWTIIGKNHLGDWDVERHEARDPEGQRLVKMTSSIAAEILPASHPHHASLLPPEVTEGADDGLTAQPAEASILQINAARMELLAINHRLLKLMRVSGNAGALTAMVDARRGLINVGRNLQRAGRNLANQSHQPELSIPFVLPASHAWEPTELMDSPTPGAGALQSSAQVSVS